MIALCSLLLAALALPGPGVSPDEPLTVPEKTAFTRTSLYEEVMTFLRSVEAGSNLMRMTPLAVSAEGRMIPLVILSKEPVRRPSDVAVYGKPVVLIMANIHAGEIEGKEACQMLIRDLVKGTATSLLDRQILLVIPIFNVDGNDKLGKNRRDNGPELAGVRPNGQSLDLNRDYVKVESPEVTGLIALFNTWDPILTVDMHTTNGSYHTHPVTWAGPSNPNTHPSLIDYMWGKLFPAVERTLRLKYGYRGIPYGGFVDAETPEKGWENDTVEARYGTNYIGLRNRFSILDENYSYADFKTRVLASHAFLQSLLEYTNDHATEMVELVRQADRATASGFSNAAWVFEHKMAKLFDVTIESYLHERQPLTAEEKQWYGDREYRMRPTETRKDYRIPYLARAEPTRVATIGDGYLIPSAQAEVIAKLKQHGIVVEKLTAPFSITGERFKIEKIELDKNIYQGHVQNRISGKWENAEVAAPAGTYYIPLRQPLGRLAAALLEPEYSDSLAAWGFFNRVIVQQWSSRPGTYPVYRLHAAPAAEMLLE